MASLDNTMGREQHLPVSRLLRAEWFLTKEQRARLTPEQRLQWAAFYADHYLKRNPVCEKNPSIKERVIIVIKDFVLVAKSIKIKDIPSDLYEDFKRHKMQTVAIFLMPIFLSIIYLKHKGRI